MKSPLRIRSIDELVKHIMSIKREDILFEPKLREMLVTYTASQIKSYNDSISLPIVRSSLVSDKEVAGLLELYTTVKYPIELEKMMSKNPSTITSQMMVDTFYNTLEQPLYDKIFGNRNHDYDNPCGDEECSECYPDPEDGM